MTVPAPSRWLDYALVGAVLQLVTFFAKSMIVQDVGCGSCAQVVCGLVALVQVLRYVAGMTLMQHQVATGVIGVDSEWINLGGVLGSHCDRVAHTVVVVLA